MDDSGTSFGVSFIVICEFVLVVHAPSQQITTVVESLFMELNERRVSLGVLVLVMIFAAHTAIELRCKELIKTDFVSGVILQLNYYPLLNLFKLWPYSSVGQN